MIFVDNISKSYNGITVLDNINITFSPGLNILVGRSGSGKTTLLNIISGLKKSDSGTVSFSEALTVDENFRSHKIGFVFQSIELLNCLTAKENVLLSAKLAEKEDADIHKLFEHFNLTEKENCYPFELSGGEKQRIAIMRAAVHKPDYIFADEPTAQLDSSSAHAVVMFFRELLVENKNLCIIMTTHDPTLLDLADKIYSLSDGKLEEEK